MRETGKLLRAQRAYFATGRTLDTKFRKRQLWRLQRAVRDHESELLQALREDLNKPDYESYGTEIGMILGEIRFALKHLDGWTKRKKVPTMPVNVSSVSWVLSEPYGSVLILSPWNYPLLLALQPLVGAIAAGNCAVVKPSEDAPAVSSVLRRLLEELYPPEYVAVAEGGVKVSQDLLREDFDMIFFTGSPGVGRLVMEAAAKNLTPVCLELGGKSPCIVDETADLRLAARRIVWGKFLNGGQTCVAPDYLLVQERVKEGLLEEMGVCIRKFYGPEPEQTRRFTRMVHQRQFERMLRLMKSGEPVIGGGSRRECLWIAPTVLDGVSWDSPIMEEEIFGPILPVLSYRDFPEALAQVRRRPKPLAAYLFTSDAGRKKAFTEQLSFGGGCINDTVMHLVSHHLPFGGVGNSGMGSYHGRESFEVFSHRKGILESRGFPDVPLRYPPYRGWYDRVMKLILR